MMYSLQNLDTSFNRAFWSDYAAMYNQLISGDELLSPRTPDEIHTEIMTDLSKDPSAYRAVILRDGRVFGYVRSYGFNMNSPKKRVIFEFDALDDRFDNDLIGLLRKTALELMDLRETDRVVYKTPHKRIQDGLERLGAEVSGELTYFILDVGKANTHLMEEAMERAGQLPNYRLQYYRTLPDEIIDEYAERYTQFLADMPGNRDADVVDPEDTRRRQRNNDPNIIYYRYVVFDDRGKIAGHTNVMLDLRAPEMAWQHMTGVVREHRGNGLAMWMKSAMYFRLLEDFPQLKRISTDTLVSNVYMQKVNALLGYEATKSAKEYKLLRRHLEQPASLEPSLL